MSGINKNLKTVANLRNYGIQSIPATVLDSSLCWLVVFETFKLFSRGEMRSLVQIVEQGINIDLKWKENQLQMLELKIEIFL